MATLNEVFSRLTMRRRYEVWFLRLALADGSGAWWFRYLLMNPGRGGCAAPSGGQPVQVWATWFPREGTPQSFIQGFPLDGISLSQRGASPFHFEIRGNEIGEDWCRGGLQVEGHRISWDLRYHSTFRVTISQKGWIGFSRTPHSDAVFSGEIRLNGQVFGGQPLGYGVQGHNCGYRHRNFWTWTHAYFPVPNGPASTFEALVYDMPFNLKFRKAVLWHEGEAYALGRFKETCRDRHQLKWTLQGSSPLGEVEVAIEGSGASVHRVPYGKTDCSGSFEVANNSLARAQIRLRQGRAVQELSAEQGAVLEMVG